MNALKANSSSVMSLVNWSLPLSPSGLAIDACNTNVFKTYLTIEVVLRSRNFQYVGVKLRISGNPPILSDLCDIEEWEHLRLDIVELLG